MNESGNTDGGASAVVIPTGGHSSIITSLIQRGVLPVGATVIQIEESVKAKSGGRTKMPPMTQERRIEIALMTPQGLRSLISAGPDTHGEEEIEWAEVCLSEKDRPSADETITQIEDRMDGRMDGNAGNRMRSPESPYYVMGWHEGSTSDEDEMELD